MNEIKTKNVYFDIRLPLTSTVFHIIYAFISARELSAI